VVLRDFRAKPDLARYLGLATAPRAVIAGPRAGDCRPVLDSRYRISESLQRGDTVRFASEARGADGRRVVA